MRKLLKIVRGGSLVLIGLALPLTVTTLANEPLGSADDPDLSRRVTEAVQGHRLFGMFDDVEVSVEDRVVTLSGRVTRSEKKDDIGRRVAKIDGVRQVVNGIRVLPNSRADDDLRQKVARAIYNHPSFWEYGSMSAPPIHIIVEHGLVTLTGQVGAELDRRLAYALAQVPGARSVRNDLRVK